MTTLTRWQPFGSIWTLRKEMDDLMERFLKTSGDWSEPEPTTRGEWWPAVEGALKDGQYVFRVALPGVDPKDVDVSFTKNVLTIKGERKAEAEGSRGQYFVRELTYGAFERSFSLPEGVDADKIHATYANGMLELTVPAPHAVTPKTIEIKVEGTPGSKAVKAA
jgi:HSP20 family protein